MDQCPIYTNPKKVCAPGDMAPLLWDDFVIHELTDVVLQKDTVFADALNRIWKHVPDRGSADDIMLKSRELNINNMHPDYPHNAMHVYAQNEHCANWNSTCLDAINDRQYTCVACDITKDQHTNLADLSFPDSPCKTGNLAKLVNIKVGA